MCLRSDIWEGPQTKRMIIGRLCSGTSCAKGQSGGYWGHCYYGKGGNSGWQQCFTGRWYRLSYCTGRIHGSFRRTWRRIWKVYTLGSFRRSRVSDCSGQDTGRGKHLEWKAYSRQQEHSRMWPTQGGGIQPCYSGWRYVHYLRCVQGGKGTRGDMCD